MRIECILIFVLIASFCNQILSQTTFEEYKRQAEQRFQQYKEQKHSEFEAYRDKVNRDFAEYMRQAWPEFKAKPAIPAPRSPEPPEPVVVAPSEKPTNEPLPFAKVTPLPPILPPPIPLLPTAEPEKPDLTPITPPRFTTPETTKKPSGSMVSFNFYGSKCSVPFDRSLRISLSSNDEQNVANAWKQLAVNESVELVESCVNLRNSLRLSDWGYLRLIEKLSQAVFPSKKDEATLLQMFILSQSGYKVRIGRNGNKLVMLIPCRENIYSYSFIPIDGANYYLVDRNISTPSTYVYNQKFPREQMFSLSIRTLPNFPMEPSPTRSFQSKYGNGISTNIAINKNIISFYNDYPLSNNWDINVNASLSEDVKSQLYPTLRQAIAGKNQQEAANILLRFVQTAFDYKTDDKQFGIERPLFPDETFYYPYSDCEDRAILYSVLVRELLGLDAVLVNYPGHLATAVKFDEDVKGDHFNINGKKYVVCDPTYINSNVGMSMPMFKGTSAKIVKL